MALIHANVAQLVEHDLAKVGVAGSSLVIRSMEVWRILQTSFFIRLLLEMIVKVRPYLSS